jgi:hypothetical protein
MSKARGKQNRLPVPVRRILTASLAAALMVSAGSPSRAQPAPIKVAVFEFELDDRSAGGGVIALDAVDTENLKLSAEEVRRLLAASGRYSIVDAGSAAGDVAAAGGIQRCNGCEAALAGKMGADQSMAGIITRVNRVEFTLQISVRDSRTGAVVSNLFTGLRMGANYAWPRGARSLINDRILSPTQPQ